MAVPATLHIGRPYMLCAPGRARGGGGVTELKNRQMQTRGNALHTPGGGGGGLSPCRGLGGGGGGERGGGRVTAASADGRPVPAHMGQGA